MNNGRSSKHTWKAVGFAAVLGACMMWSAPAAACQTTDADRREECQPLFVPRLATAGPQPFLWLFALHDERSNYLVRHGVPRIMADKIAIGGVPLQGQERADQVGWYVVPAALAGHVKAIF